MNFHHVHFRWQRVANFSSTEREKCATAWKREKGWNQFMLLIGVAIIWFSVKESPCQSSEMMSNLKLIVNCIWLIGKVVSWSWGNQHWACRALSPANRSCSCSKFNKMADLSVRKRAQTWQSSPMLTLHWSIIGCFVSPVTCSWPVSIHSEPLQKTACALYTAIWFYWTIITVPSFCVKLLCTY